MKSTTILLLVVLMMWGAGSSLAQEVDKTTLMNPVAIGVRANPDGGGLTAKIFLNKNWNIEAQVNGSQGYYHMDNGRPYGPGWATVGMAEYNFVFRDPSYRIYIGAGLHGGKWDKYDHTQYADAPLAQGIFGADAIVGAEYIFKSVPLGISIDAKPAVNFGDGAGFYPNNLYGVAVRYYFCRRELKTGATIHEPEHVEPDHP